jgi:tetratricopeptide (TPR) repeat protein
VDDLLLMAQAYSQAERYEEYSRYLERAAQAAPLPRRANILRELAMSYRERGMYDKAEQTLEAAAGLAPNNFYVLAELANQYFLRRGEGARLEKAVALREKVLARNPDDADNWEKMGAAYTAAGQVAKGVRCLEHAIDLEPGNGPVYLQLSKAYAAMGDQTSSKSARAFYTRYVSYDQHSQTLRTRARRPGATAADMKMYADLLFQSGGIEDAARWYEKALALSPKDAGVRRSLIAAYSRLRRTDRILELRASAPAS